jgi:TPR repeat protein
MNDIIKSYVTNKEQHIYIAPDIEKKKLANFIHKVKEESDINIQESSVLVYFDNTVFGGGKEGVVLTSDKIICNPLGVNAWSEYLDNIRSVEVSSMLNVTIVLTMANNKILKIDLTQSNKGAEVLAHIIKQYVKKAEITKKETAKDSKAQSIQVSQANTNAEEEGKTVTVECLKKHAEGRDSIDSHDKRNIGGGFTIPKDFDHFHYIACIFKIFADKVGQNLLPDVSKKTSELLQEWLPEDLTAPQIFKIIQPKLDELYNYDAGMVAFFLKTATQEIMEAGIFKESNLRSIVLDLVDIAEADGEITENEAKFINRIAQYFGVEFSITATARGVKKAKREEYSPKVGDQKNNVDAEAYFDKGYQFEKDDNYEEAAKWYKKAAELGHAYAQASLGDAYSQGEGVPEDKPEAVKWYKKAAEQGLDYAQFCLGSAYSAGEGVPEDKKEAAKWYKKSAEQGFKMSQYFLGFAYYSGEGVPEDKAESIKWHREAAEQGLDEAQYFLGWAYENGEGVSVNNQEALKWYKLAAAQDNKDAQEAISRLSDVNQSDKDDIELVPKGKRVTYSDWSEFEKEQGEKNEQKKNNLPIAKKIHDLMFDVFSEKNKIFEIRYGDGTFSLSIPKDKAKSGKRTFARVGLLSLADKCVYLDTLYRVTGTAIPPGSFTWKKNDDSQFLFRIKTIEDFEKVRNSIKQSVIGSYNCLAKTKIA